MVAAARLVMDRGARAAGAGLIGRNRRGKYGGVHRRGIVPKLDEEGAGCGGVGNRKGGAGEAIGD